MKKNRILIIFIIGVLFVCAFTQMSVYGQEQNMNVKCTGSVMPLGNSIVFTEDGFYWIYDKMYYTDWDTLQTTPVCSNPECRHVNPELCFAIRGNITDFQLYDEKLYTMELSNGPAFSRYIVESTPAGTETRRVMKMSEDYLGSLCSETFEIYNGYVIFLGNYGSVCVGKLGDSIEDCQTLLEITQDDFVEEAINDGWTIDAEDMSSTGEIFSWRFWEDHDCLYYMGNYGVRGARRPYDLKYANQLYRYNIMEDTCELVWTLPSSEEVGEWKLEGISTNGWYIRDDVIYFFLTGNGMWKTDLNTGIHEKVFQTDANGTAFFNGEYVYINNSDYTSIIYNGFKSEKRMIRVVKMDGTEINQISLQELYEDNHADYIEILGSYGDELILQLINFKNMRQDVKYYLLNAITGELQMFGHLVDNILVEY